MHSTLRAMTLAMLFTACADNTAPGGGSGGAPADAADGAGAGGAGGAGTGQPPSGSVCQEALERSSCPKIWEGSKEPTCSRDPLGYTIYTGPSKGHLVRAKITGFFGKVCFYDAASNALVAEQAYSDIPSFCCDSAHTVWRGPPVPGFQPLDLLCTPADGGVDASDTSAD